MPLVQNPLAWNTHHKNDYPPPPAARDAHEELPQKNWWEFNKIYQHRFDRMNSHKIGKKRVHKDSAQSVQDLQSSLVQALVAPRSPPLSCPSMNKERPTFWQVLIKPCPVTLEVDNAQLEMAIADFFHCENIADQEVDSTRFKYMLKQAWLMGGEFRPPTRKKMDVRLFNFICFITSFSNIKKVNCWVETFRWHKTKTPQNY